jgi:hypothetical protein
MCDFSFQTKYTGITALISAFDRATAQLAAEVERRSYVP